MGLKAAIDTSSSTNIELLLIKNTDDPGKLIQKIVGDTTYLKVEEGVSFVGQCNYYVSAETSKRFIGSLKIAGVEISNEEAFSQAITGFHNSNFFIYWKGIQQVLFI